ncbi:ATP-binding protein [Ideonella sp. A 288]|uniref:ATP-binding protein n=1 Tax=Ideonella sp. A 288 TaxID=1962181 RepID=UPI001F473263|nr:ATP-binding protein [Ideonella sp. A 288]
MNDGTTSNPGATAPGGAWFGDAEADARMLSDPHNSSLHGLRLLLILRFFAPITQALTLYFVTYHYQVHIDTQPLLMLIGMELVVAVATLLRLRGVPRVTAGELFLQVHVDILMFAGVLYLTGGATNPFAPLFLLPVAISASSLTPKRVWLTALSTMAVYAFLRDNHVPLHHPNGHTEVYQLHEDGMVVNYIFTAALLAFFVNRMHAAFLRHERRLADARDSQMRSESVVAIGALAAGYAHELSSPLATIAVVVAELKREHAKSPALFADLQLVEDQVRACKQIVSNLTHAGGQRRAESASGAKLDVYLLEIIDKARALYPNATIKVALDPVTPPPAVVAEETLRQAIMNLIQNAVRAAPQQIEFSAYWAGPDLLVKVRDRGPGFSAELLKQLGKRALPTARNPNGGMGVGLLLSASTLARLGGSLELKNDPAGGANAEIRVPLSAILIEQGRR